LTAENKLKKETIDYRTFLATHEEEILQICEEEDFTAAKRGLLPEASKAFWNFICQDIALTVLPKTVYSSPGIVVKNVAYLTVDQWKDILVKALKALKKN